MSVLAFGGVARLPCLPSQQTALAPQLFSARPESIVENLLSRDVVPRLEPDKAKVLESARGKVIGAETPHGTPIGHDRRHNGILRMRSVPNPHHGTPHLQQPPHQRSGGKRVYDSPLRNNTAEWIYTAVARIDQPPSPLAKPFHDPRPTHVIAAETHQHRRPLTPPINSKRYITVLHDGHMLASEGRRDEHIDCVHSWRPVPNGRLSYSAAS